MKNITTDVLLESANSIQIIQSVSKSWAEKWSLCYDGPKGRRWDIKPDDSPDLQALKKRANSLITDIEGGCEECIPDGRTPPPHLAMGAELMVRVKQIERLEAQQAKMKSRR